jgi:5-methylcytosine-specific restriction endonuclease McrA
MPPPKDPEKLAAYRERMRRIALERGYGKWMEGKKASPETLAKERAVQQARTADPEERRRRSERAKAAGVGKWMAGRTMSDGTRRALDPLRSLSYKERYGERAEEERRKRRESNRRRWDGVERKPQRDKHNGDHRYTDCRTAVFIRDNHTCRRCGIRGGQLHAHHIRSWAEHPEDRYDPDNVVTLHHKCHRDVHRALHAGEVVTFD